MPRTEVMLIGALPAQAGFPGAGGPIPPSVRFPYPQPDFRMNRHAVIPSTWMEPQNLLQVTDKTNYDPFARASAGKPISPALAGVFSPLLFGRGRRLGDGETPPVATSTAAQAYDAGLTAEQWKKSWMITAAGYSILGAAMAANHGYRRNKGATGWAVMWGLFGACFPLLTNGVALAQGYGKSG